MKLSLIDRLMGIHSALDDSLGDSDVTHIEDDEELRDRHPVQWAAQKLAEVIDELEHEVIGEMEAENGDR